MRVSTWLIKLLFDEQSCNGNADCVSSNGIAGHCYIPYPDQVGIQLSLSVCLMLAVIY